MEDEPISDSFLSASFFSLCFSSSVVFDSVPNSFSTALLAFYAPDENENVSLLKLPPLKRPVFMRYHLHLQFFSNPNAPQDFFVRFWCFSTHWRRIHETFHLMPIPCNASRSSTCPASLNFIPSEPKTIEETASLFNVNTNSVNKTSKGFLISVNCSCPAAHDEFVWHADYTIQRGDTWGRISSEFGYMVVEKPEKQLIPLLNVILDILCGCSEGKHIVTYVVDAGDTLYTICSRFKCNVVETQRLNGIDNSALIHVGDVIFIPTKGRED
ncbi:hypothetical protein ACLOJK_032000 [Asimina triloba]